MRSSKQFLFSDVRHKLRKGVIHCVVTFISTLHLLADELTTWTRQLPTYASRLRGVLLKVPTAWQLAHSAFATSLTAAEPVFAAWTQD